MLKENLARVRERIATACQSANRLPEDIRLICVTKTATLSQMKEAVVAGITDIGENRVDDALLKYSQLDEGDRRLKWHMVGHLQRSKVRKALEIFDTIHSLDSLRLAEEIDKKAGLFGKRVDCLVEVNTSGEATKYGIKPDDTLTFIKQVSAFSHIHITGLMTMAPLVDDAELARPYFIKLRQLKENLQSKNIPYTDIRELSMGMSQDFEVAIEEGATFVRIGTAIFGL